ncbi:MAG: arylsulfatase [bacterium]
MSKDKRPNIVLIMVDDMGYSDLGCFGAEKIKTPHIDQLAEKGLKFTQMYNAARCCPTRASLLTGLYPHQAGVGDMVGDLGIGPEYQGYLRDDCVTIAEVLKEAGYTTLMSGKWHVGEEKPHWPTDRGFDRYFGLISGAANYFDITKTKAEGVTRQMAEDGESWEPPEEGFYMTEAITEKAVDFLDSQAQKEEPFFLYVPYTAPHWPLHALPEDIEKYRGEFSQGWDELRNKRYQNLIEAGIIKDKWQQAPRDEKVDPWEDVDNKEEMAQKMAVYAAQMDRMDQGVGKILAHLEKMGQRDNTIVVFLSDNGGCHEGGPYGFDRRGNGLPPGGEDSYMSYGRSWANLSNTPFRLFKHWVHEGGISTPLIISWPQKIEKSQLVDSVAHVSDLTATFIDLAEADYPVEYNGKQITPLEGESFRPLLEGKEWERKKPVFWEHEGNCAVRDGKWKLVSRFEKQEWELYNMAEDRTELNDLSSKRPKITKKLKEKYEIWKKRCGVQERPLD